MPARTVVLTMLLKFRREGHGPAGGHCDGLGLWTQLGFKFRDTVTVAARFKFKVRGLGLEGYEDSDSEAACQWIPTPGQSPARY